MDPLQYVQVPVVLWSAPPVSRDCHRFSVLTALASAPRLSLSSSLELAHVAVDPQPGTPGQTRGAGHPESELSCLIRQCQRTEFGDCPKPVQEPGRPLPRVFEDCSLPCRQKRCLVRRHETVCQQLEQECKEQEEVGRLDSSRWT